MHRDPLHDHIKMVENADHRRISDAEWMRVPLLNWMTTLMYGVLIVLLMAMGHRLYSLMHILWHIMPGRRKLVKSLVVDKAEIRYLPQFEAMYHFHIDRPWIRNILCGAFSKDVGNVIMLYLPKTYPEDLRLDENGGRNCWSRKSKNARRESMNGHRRYVESYWNSPCSSSAHLAIDCVDPLPASFSKYDSNQQSLKYKDFDGFKWYQFDTASIGDPDAK
jgi:hypothetical protein